MSLKVAFFKCTFGNKLYYDLKYKKSKYNVECGSLKEEKWLQAQWKETSLLNFHTRNYWAGLFKSIFLYELYMAIITEVHSQGKNILNDNLLISCQIGKIHSFLQICSWFFINILNDFLAMHLGYLWLYRKKYMRVLDPTFHLQYITNLHAWLWKQ